MPCSSNLVRYKVLATIFFLIAISFHASVYRRFGSMENGLNEAAHIKFAMEWDEMRAFKLYGQANELHRDGIMDLLLAYEYASEAYSLKEDVFEEEENANELREDAKEKDQEARVDARESAMWGMKSFRDNRTAVGLTITGM